MKYTEAEQDAILEDPLNNKTRAQLDTKEQVYLIEQSPDLMFGIWCNSGNKQMLLKPIEFTGHFRTHIPSKNLGDPR